MNQFGSAHDRFSKKDKVLVRIGQVEVMRTDGESSKLVGLSLSGDPACHPVQCAYILIHALDGTFR